MLEWAYVDVAPDVRRLRRSSHPLSDLTKSTGHALHQLSGAQSQLLIAAQRFADIIGVSCMSK
jgi:hypothetical protein